MSHPETVPVEQVDREWLVAQLLAWPTRVHPDYTTNIQFLMQQAGAALQAAAERERSLREALEPFAKLGKMLEGPFAPALFRDDQSAGIGGAWSENGEPRFVTFGDLRRASQALGESA